MEQEEINRLRERLGWAAECVGPDHAAAIMEADATLLAQAERVKVLEEALERAAVRLNICAGWIEDFPASGTLRAERAMKARQMGDEATTALEQTGGCE